MLSKKLKDICKTCEGCIKIRENWLSSPVNDHINSKKHGESKNISEPKQVILHRAFEASNSQQLMTKDFLFDLTKMMTEFDIPLTLERLKFNIYLYCQKESF